MENVEYYDTARQLVELLRGRGIPCELYGAGNPGHSYPPDFDVALPRALAFLTAPA